MNRPNVPMLVDDAAALLARLSAVDQVKSFSNFKAAGLKFALLLFVHFDLDGHGANNMMVQDVLRGICIQFRFVSLTCGRMPKIT